MKKQSAIVDLVFYQTRLLSHPVPNSKANSVLNQSKIQKLSVLIQTLIQVTFRSEFL